MKKIVLLFGLALGSTTLFAQLPVLMEKDSEITQDPGEEPIYTSVESMPQFPGGEAALLKFIRDSLVYPQRAIEMGIEGKTYIGFVVEKDGSISHVTVLRGIDESTNKEALRVMRLMPRWTPGKQGGKPMRVRYNLPISFRLK